MDVEREYRARVDVTSVAERVDLVVEAKRRIAVEPGFVAPLSDAGFVLGEATVRRSIASGGIFQLLGA